MIGNVEFEKNMISSMYVCGIVGFTLDYKLVVSFCNICPWF